MWLLLFTILAMFFLFIIIKTMIVVPQHENVVKERLGKFAGVLKPGFHFMIPFLDRSAYRHEMREQPIDIPSQSCITRDNIQVEVDGIVYLKIVDAEKASYGIGDYRLASINLAQTTMRSEIGKISLDETFSERDRINENIVREIDVASDPWGVKMNRYEIMNITPSLRVIDTMEKQMEAERSKRAEITISNGRKEAQIQISEGERQMNMNRSEGSRQQSINEAEGKAVQIRVIADATAQGINMISSAINKPGGKHAVRTQLIEQYIEKFGKITSSARINVLPSDLANLKGVVESLGIATKITGH